MIATLMGGKNDGALVNIPFEEPDDILPFFILVQYKEGKLKYALEHANFKEGKAVYEYSGIER